MDTQAQKTRTVRRYYDQNTPLFLSLGSSPATLSIHRAVWATSVHSLNDALDHTNSLILGEIEALVEHFGLEQVRIADLGCGVGGGLFYLLERLDTPALGIGLTISPVQARIAAKTRAQKHLLATCLFLEADFQATPLTGEMDVVYSVEAFVHAPDPRGYFTEASRLLKPGGRLILCDDFLARPVIQEKMAETARTWLGTYLEGWQVNSLYPAEEIERIAGACQLILVRDEDLTPYLRLRLLPKNIALLLLKAGRLLPVRHAMLPSMLGSMALQECLQMGIIQYRYLVFEKHG